MIKDLVNQENLKVSNAVSTARGFVATHKNVMGGLPPVSLKISGKCEQNGTPTPDAPVEVEGAGNKSGLTVVSCRKDLFDESRLLTASGWTLTDGYYTGYSSTLHTVFKRSEGGFVKNLKSDKQYTISLIGKCKENTSNNAIVLVTYLDGTEERNAFALTTTDAKYVFTTSKDKKIKSIAFHYGIKEIIYIKEFQIEEGTKATPYEPYTGTEVNIPLDGPLYENDTITYNMGRSGEESHKQFEMILDGSEGWKNSDFSTGGYFVLTLGDYGIVVGDKIICSHFEQKAISGANKNIGINVINSTTFNEARLLVRPNIDGVTNLETWKAWLAENKPKVVYELTTPTVTPLTEAQITAIESLVAQDGLTNVMSEGMVESGYLANNADGKAVLSLSKVIDKKVNDLKNTNQSEHTALSDRITALENNGWTEVAYKIMAVDLSSYKEVLVVLSGGDVQYVTINIPFDELDGGTNVYGTGVYLTPESYWGGYVEIDSEGVYDHAFYMTGVKEQISNIAVYAR